MNIRRREERKKMELSFLIRSVSLLKLCLLIVISEIFWSCSNRKDEFIYYSNGNIKIHVRYTDSLDNKEVVFFSPFGDTLYILRFLPCLLHSRLNT